MCDLAVMQVEEVRRSSVRFKDGQALSAEMEVALFAQG